MTTIAIIPARGGSKRVPRKNLSLVGGKPLIGHAIDVAHRSGVFESIYVNSDDEEVLQVAVEFGAIPYARPLALGGDEVFIIDALKEMLATLKASSQTTVGILLATCPLRTPSDIQNAYTLFCDGPGTPVVSVAKYETPIQLAQYVDGDGRLTAFFPEDYRRSTRSTDHRTALRFNEAIVFNSTAGLLAQYNLIGDRPIPYLMPEERSIAVDYPYQMELIGRILAARKSS